MDCTHNKYHILFFACLIIATIVLWKGLNGPFVLDDFYNLAPLLNSEKQNYSSVILSNESGPLGRSVSMLTFVINHWIRGELSVFDLKLTNLFFHLANGVLLYLLLIILLKNCSVSNQRQLLALVISSCWMLSPVNTSVLFYAIQRMAMLSAFFILMGCLIYIYIRPLFFRGPQKKTFACSLLLFCWALASLSKENGILFPAFILCIELCFFDDLRLWIKNLTSYRKTIYLSGLTILVCLIVGFITHKGYLDYSNVDFDFSERMFTQPIVILDYMYGLFIPFDMDISLYTDDYHIQTEFWNFKTIVSTLVLVFMLFICIYSILINKLRYLSYGLLFYLIGHSIESSIFPLEMYFNHRNYLPSIGIYIFLCLLFYKFISRIGMDRVFIPVFGIYLSIFTFYSYQRADVWSSQEKIIVNAVYYHPLSVRANLTMVEMLKQNGKIEQAFEINNKIIQSKDNDLFRPLIQRLYLYCWAGLTLPEYEYSRLSRNFDRSHGRETSNALQNLLYVAQITQCKGVNLVTIAGNLSKWIDNNLLQKNYTTEQLWHLEYNVIEYLSAFDQKELAKQRLKRYVDSGNVAAIEYSRLILNK